MDTLNYIVTSELDIWLSAVEKKSGAGRSSGGGTLDVYGIRRLRELILELAIRGKLVGQSADEGTGLELLQSILKQQSEMFSRGEIKKPKQTKEIDPKEIPYELPTGWTWCRISQLGHDWGQKVPDTDFTYIDVGSINKELGLVSEPKVLKASEAPSRARKVVRSGTVIYSTVRPYLLNIAVVGEGFDPEPIASTAFAIVHPFDGVLASYLYWYLRSPKFVSYVENCQTGIAYPAINDRQFFSALVPLPPLQEQRRIIKKVDDLIELCEKLERQTKAKLAAHQTLVETCLGALIGSQSADDFTKNWNRIASNFDVLFSDPLAFELLEQAIYEMAVRGLLVEQLPSSDTASEFLTSNGSKPTVGSGEPSLPVGWSYCTFGDLGAITGGGTPSKSNPKFWNGDVPWVTPKDMKVDYISDATDCITEEAIEGSSAKLISEGSLLLVVRGMILAHSFPVAITNVPVAINQDMKAIDLGSFDRAFALILMKAIKREVLSRVERSTHGTCKLVSDRLFSIVLPIPPLEEQERIAQRVSELISICQQARQSLSKSQEISRQLADVVAGQNG